MRLIKLLLADDHTLVRAGLRALIREIPNVDVIAETGDGFETLSLVKSEKPDVVLLDITMPGLNGLEVAAQIHRKYPLSKVIILSMHSDEDCVHLAVKAGASGYLLKESASKELEIAIQAVARGEAYFCTGISKQLADQLNRQRLVSTNARPNLAPRQRQLLQLLAEGKTIKEIARLLHISVATAYTHRKRLMEKTEISEIAGLVQYAIQLGLVLRKPLKNNTIQH